MIQHFRLSHLAILALALPLQACMSGDDDNSSPLSPAALAMSAEPGFVSFLGGVSEAQIEIVDLHAPAGTAARSLGGTSSGGMFLGNELARGGDYRIEAFDGVLSDGSPLKGRLAVEIRNHDGGPVYLNPVTTLASRYLAAHPQLTLAQAEEAVRRFLQLPAHQNLGAGLDVDTEEFNYQRFHSAMGATAFDTFIDQLVTEMSASADATHNFRRQALLQSGIVPAAALVFVGQNLVAGALGKAGGEAMGQLLTLMGLGDATASEFAAIKNTLRQMQAQLRNLEDQTTAIQGELKVVQYNSGVTALSPLITAIKNHTSDLNQLLNLAPADYDKDPDGWNKVRADLYNAICRIYTEGKFGSEADQFDDLLRGTQSGTPLITLFGQTKTNGRRLFNYQDSQDLFAVRQYWETIQAHLFNLVDVYLSTGQSENGCNSTASSPRLLAKPGTAIQAQREKVAKNFEERQLAQVAKYPAQLLPKDTAIDITAKTMVRTDLVMRPYLNSPVDGYSGYSSTQDSTWNYAHLTMNSANSPMPADPAYLRNGWRLISLDELRRYFDGGNPAAVQRGWPAASTWAHEGAPYNTSERIIFSRVMVWKPLIANFTLIPPDHYMVSIPVRSLTSEEDYLPK